MRPDFIPREIFRPYINTTELNRHLRVDGLLASSFITRCERAGTPVRHQLVQGYKRWRLLDLVAKASAHGFRVEPAVAVELARDVDALRAEKAELVADIASRKHVLALHKASEQLTGATLLTESEIAAGRVDYSFGSGVYFLLHGDKVVYVGQAVNVISRVSTHRYSGKEFDGFAYIPCPPPSLNLLESLYIHVLRPKFNAVWNDGVGVHAPLRLDVLLAKVS